MKLVFKKPESETHYQSNIYTTEEALDVHRVMIGAEGSLMDFQGTVQEFVEESDFLNREGIEVWVEQQVKALREAGKEVEFDENPSYLMGKMIDQLVEDSPITVNPPARKLL